MTNALSALLADPSAILGAVWQHGLSGGPFMFPIVLTALVIFTTFLHEAAALFPARREMLAYLQKRDPSCLTGERRRTLERWRQLRTGVERTDRTLRDAVLADAAGYQASRTILVFAGLATLLGLLGTVTGMMTAFTAIAENGFADVQNLSEGVAEALVTTQGGLMTAVPGVVLGRWLKRKEDAHRLLLTDCLGLSPNVSGGKP